MKKPTSKAKTALIKLLPCPFCGGKAILHEFQKADSSIKYFPRCQTGSMNEGGRDKKGVCIGNQGWWGFETQEAAAKAWNKRAQ